MRMCCACATRSHLELPRYWTLFIALILVYVNQCWRWYCSRGAHTSVYDKNLDDELRPNVVPDDVIKPQSDKYWAPHPRTGVFGPATEQHLSEISGDSASVGDGGQDPVLEEKAWFRPTSLEDLEKPHRLNWQIIYPKQRSVPSSVWIITNVIFMVCADVL